MLRLRNGCLRKKLGQNWVALAANSGDVSNLQENVRNEKRNMQRFSNLIFKGSKVWKSGRRKENPFFIRWDLSGEPKTNRHAQTYRTQLEEQTTETCQNFSKFCEDSKPSSDVGFSFIVDGWNHFPQLFPSTVGVASRKWAKLSMKCAVCFSFPPVKSDVTPRSDRNKFSTHKRVHNVLLKTQRGKTNKVI